MALTIEQANAVNCVIGDLAGEPTDVVLVHTKTATINALVLLAGHAYKALGAGYTGESARAALEGGWEDPNELRTKLAAAVRAATAAEQHADAAPAGPVDLTAVAGALAETARNIDAHIDRRAGELAEKKTEPYVFEAFQAKEQQKDQEARFKERLADLQKEFERQRSALIKRAERAEAERDEAQAAVRRVEQVRTWRNEDDKKFVFVEDLVDALRGSEPAETAETGGSR